MTSAEGPALAALRALHDRLWDDEQSLDRVPPGDRDRDRHSVRETALVAFLDLNDGNVSRATRAIDRVLRCQYRDRPNTPWSGTFKCLAEEPDPPTTGAMEWVHYDPNWRQFLGCVLAYTLDCHESLLPEQLREAMEDAIYLCVIGEPTDRIPRWYTNPRLMHAWLCGWLGRRRNEPSYLAVGEEWVDASTSRLDRSGDVDEYNSPTYDGIDLFALALWLTRPPSERFERAGERLRDAICQRLSRLFHPGLGAICGPYVRAYGLSLNRYVSLAGVWFALAGAEQRHVLPAVLDIETDHVHDLYFFPVFESLARAITSHLAIEAVTSPRDHTQRFRDVVAVSRLDPSRAIGCEQGRASVWTPDQYFPYTVHHRYQGSTLAAGVRLGASCEGLDALPGAEGHTTLRAKGRDGTVEVVFLFSEIPDIASGTFRLGGLLLEPGLPPDETAYGSSPNGTEVRARWRRAEVVVEASVRPDFPA